MAPDSASAPPGPSSPPAERRRSWPRRIFRWSLWLLMIIVVLLTAAAIWLQTDHGKATVRAFVLDTLNDAIAGRLEVDRIDGNLFGSVELHGVRIFDPEGLRVLAVEGVTADTHLLDLLDSEVHLSEVRVIAPHFTLLDEAGRVAIARAFAERVPTPPDPDAPVWTVRLEGLRLSRGHFGDRVAGGDLAFEHLDINVSLSVTDGITWRDLSLRTDATAPLQAPLSVASEGTLREGSFDIERLAVAYGPHRLVAAGRFTPGEPPSGDIRIDSAEIDLDALPAGLLPAEAQGKASADGSLTITDGRLIAQLALRTLVGRLKVQGSANLRANPVSYEAALSFDDLRPGAILAEVPAEFTAQGSLTVEGAGDPLRGDPFSAYGEVIELTPNPGARLALRTSVPQARPADTDGGALFAVAIDGAGWVLDPWLANLGEPGIKARLARVDGSGVVQLSTTGAPSVRLLTELAGNAVGRLASGEDVAVPWLDGELALDWPGAGLPLGTIVLRTEDLVFGQRGARQLAVDAAISAAEGDAAGHRIKGTITAIDLVPRAGAQVARAVAPLDLRLRDLEGLPEGLVDFEVSGFRDQSRRAGRAAGRLSFTRARGGLAVEGTLQAGALSLGREFSLGTASGTVTGWVHPRGRFDGRALVTLGTLRSGDVSVRTASVDLTLDASDGLSRSPSARGTITATDLRGPDGLRAATSVVELDVALQGDVPVGDAKVSAGRVVAGGRTWDAVEVVSTVAADGQASYRGRFAAGVLSGVFFGTVLLPVGGRTALEARVDELVVREQRRAGIRRGSNEPVLVARGVEWRQDGPVALGGLELVGANDTITLDGSIDPATGALDLHLDAEDARISSWIPRLEVLAGVDLSGLPVLDGVVTVSLELGGSLARPLGTLQLGLSKGRMDELQGLSGLVSAELDESGLLAGVGLSWHEGGRVQFHVDLPMAPSLRPAALHWHPQRQVLVRLNASESDLGQLQTWLLGVRGRNAPSRALRGKASLEVTVEGPVESPFIGIVARGEGVASGGQRPFDVALNGTSHGGKTTLSVSALREGKRVLTLKTVAPFDGLQVAGADDVLGFLEHTVRAEPGTFELDVARIKLGDLPVAPLLSAELRAISVETRLAASGRLSEPRLDGFVEVTPLPSLGLDSIARVDLETTSEGMLRLAMGIRARDREVVEGRVDVPRFGSLAVAPQTAPSIVNDPDFGFWLFSEDMSSAELWDFSQGLGEVATRFLPDARVVLHVSARGSEQGLKASVAARLRNQQVARRSEALVRNIAQDMWLQVQLDAERTTVGLRMTQDNEFAFFNLGAQVGLGSRQLLAGELGDIAAIPLSGALNIEEFEIAGLSQNVIGPSEGEMRGEVVFSGTLGAPRAVGSLDAHARDLVIEAIGIQEDQMQVSFVFSGDRIELIPIRLEDESSIGDDGEATRFMELAFAATMKRAEASEIALDGSVVLQEFTLFERRDLKGKLDGRIDIGGTVERPTIAGKLRGDDLLINPQLGGRNVRGLGLPQDVTLVAGPPVAPFERTRRSRFGTGADIDVEVEIPRDEALIKNDLLDLSPWGTVRARTDEGVLGLTGTVYVPKNKVDLFGREFVVSEDSRVVFTGDLETDPQLRVKAHFDISDVDLSPINLETTEDSRVIVTITGNAVEPVLTLASDPPMNKSNIISVVVTGAPVGPAENQEDGFESRIANLVIGLATGTLGQLVTQQLPIDLFELDTKSGDLRDSRLTVGKRLTKDLIVRYRLDSRAETDEASVLVNEFNATYRLGKILNVEGTANDVGEFSLELNLRFRD